MARPLHVAMFVDQHPHTLGGMQTSVLLQRKHLRAAGHTVTIVSPRMHRDPEPEPGIIALPTLRLGNGEYGMCVPGAANVRRVEAALAGGPAVDVSHIQADYWQAMIGYRFARRLGIPVVHTMHNRVDVGLQATLPIPGAVQRFMGWLQQRTLGGPGPAPREVWSYLRGFTRAADAVTAPSSHFARLLESHHVFPRVDVVPSGLDDDVARELLATPRPLPAGTPGRHRVRLAWIGRFSAEKRLLPFLEAVGRSGIAADIHIFGEGAERGKAEKLARGITSAAVTFRGRVPYRSMLAELRQADALVQTSQGFETQGMTVYEAAALGTPTILSDWHIAEDLPEGSYWLTPDDSVSGLAWALSAAVDELRQSTVPRAVLDARDFLQGRQTRHMVEIYRRAIAADGGGRVPQGG